MASYFEEHDCTPLSDGESIGISEITRFILDHHLLSSEQMEQMVKNPPAAKKFIEDLQIHIIKENDKDFEDEECTICLVKYVKDSQVIRLSCKHSFHKNCITLWLKKSGTCPLCREDFPTDDPTFEEIKAYKKRDKERKADIESLHNSMYG